MEKTLKKICPVCGYDKLQELPYGDNEGGQPSFEVCSCCGFEYGFHDLNSGYSFEKYLQEWINKGYSFYFEEDKPKGWGEKMMKDQLRNKQQLNYSPRL